MKTRAAIHVGFGQPLVVEEIELPDPGPNQVRVKHFASGVCHSQLHQLARPTQPTPTIIGHESTGVVTAVGCRVVHVKEGDHVMTTWLPRDGHPTPSDGFEGVTFRGEQLKISGEFRWAEDVIIDQHLVVRMDPGIPTDVTSIVGCAVMTGCGAAMNTAGVRPGNSVAVFGVGGVGLSVVAACANLSADPVIVVDLADEKLEFAKKFG
ncbi:MAG: alcohol dehydrogenase catalytic domain-containing protein, partial [Chloroflexota bacterium]|nr:alcohol dehydrogenase catalytic domain-containing protein [Chloroflexota bacterium]